MAKFRKVIEIGTPQSDGRLLVFGFGRPQEEAGRTFRWTFEKCSLYIPVVSGARNRLRIELSSNVEQKTRVTIGKSRLGQIKVPAHRWKRYEFVIPASATRGKPQVLLGIENEIYFGPSWNAMCLKVGKIEVSAEAAGPEEPPPPEEARAESKVFWGDIHVHSNLSMCDRPNNGSPEENYEYARSEAEHDFISIADHIEHMNEEEWEFAKEEMERANEEGLFVTIPAYEWTSSWFGHKNFYAPEVGIPHLSSTRVGIWRPTQVWKALEEWGGEVITVPHHTARTEFLQNWNYHHSKFQPIAEIYSKWGCFEYWGHPLQDKEKTLAGNFLQDAWARGYRLGVVAGSDGHSTPPGSRGLTGILAEELTRRALYDALVARRCYATTGARIFLEVEVTNGAFGSFPMGSIITLSPYEAEAFYPFLVSVRVIPTAPVEKIEVLENNKVVYVSEWSPGNQLENLGQGGMFHIKRRDYSTKPKEGEVFFNFAVDWPSGYRKSRDGVVRRRRSQTIDRFLYVRVLQRDGHWAWSSPIWVTIDI